MQADRPKQYLVLGNKTVLEWTIDAITRSADISGIVVGIATTDAWFQSLGLDKISDIWITEGGEERAHTVLNCINYLQRTAGAMASDWLLVHDAVRPCVSSDDISRLIHVCRQQNRGGLLGCEIVDTVKRVDKCNQVIATEPRSGLWRAMTPQMFPLGELDSALKISLENKNISTDESAAMEMTGMQPLMIEGRASNIKITRPEDLDIARVNLEL